MSPQKIKAHHPMFNPSYNPYSLYIYIYIYKVECECVKLRGFFNPTHHSESKKFNPTHHISSIQPTWVELGQMESIS